MDRKEFMRQLAVLLRDLPDSERMDPRQLKDVRVDMTIKDGRVVFDRNT